MSDRRHGDTYDGLVQHLARQAHGPGEGAAQKGGEIAVTIVGQPAANSVVPAHVILPDWL